MKQILSICESSVGPPLSSASLSRSLNTCQLKTNGGSDDEIGHGESTRKEEHVVEVVWLSFV